jgi:hypothetical protein
MLLSGWIKKRFGLPVVLDFQDPWVSAWGATLPKWSKGGFAHRLAVALEPRALRHADYITSVSDRQNEELAARHPWLDATRMAAIPIGGDPEDFKAVRDNGDAADLIGRDEIVYVGRMWSRAEPVVARLVRAIAACQAQRSSQCMRVRFVGTDPRLNDEPVPQLSRILSEQNAEPFIVENPGRVSFVDALSIMTRARALIVFGSDERHYTASKIYPILMSGRPYLSIFREDSSAHRTLTDAAGGAAIGFRSLDHLDQLVPEITRALERLAHQPPSFQATSPAAYADFTADSVARRYAQILEQIT